jgi:hypothetical protein
MAIELTESAQKRGYTVAHVIYCIENAYVARPGFEPARVPGRGPVTLWLGPSRDALNPVLEMFGELIPPDTLRIFHMMPLRERFRYLLEEE